ncbi:hypothetical protein GJ744_010040 [Endocarpon pusillum]|uniref:Uncharacterized protein n=1 Tax=Endocarpon pusillum TaxID=364733 RepID=A0A8H7AIX1_9EURO|nr:hypothetical protein GJ744_010040 [Endocarpon pusillum]
MSMCYWGQYLFQSDPDYDVLGELSERAGFELFYFESDEEETKARNALDEGKLNELFDIIREEEKKRSLVLLTAVCHASRGKDEAESTQSDRKDLQKGASYGRSSVTD